MNYYIISGNLFVDISSHLPNFVIMKSTYKINDIRDRPKLILFSKRNILSFIRELENTSWENVMTYKDTDECFDIFTTKYDQIFYKCFPLTMMSIKRCNDKTWMTKGTRNSIMMKSRLYKTNIKRQNDNNKTAHRHFKISSQLLYGGCRKYSIVICSYMQSILPGSYGNFTHNLLIMVNGILLML